MQASTTQDDRKRKQLERDGVRDQEAWKCPRRDLPRHAPPQPEPITSPQAKQALEWVANLTGAEGLCTCPLYYARLEWVSDVIRLRRWWKSGQLAQRLPHPSGVVVDAIDAIEDSITAREAWEMQRAMETARQADAARKHKGGPPSPITPPKP
jgi:hypothetical protein